LYKIAVVAIELAAEPARQVLERACAFARDSLRGLGALRVLHVVEPQYVQYSFDPTFTGALTRAMEDEAIDAARRRVAELCAPFGIPESQQTVVMGRAADRIHETAASEGADLVILGSHGREGLRALLGSTATAALHNAPVDVMTVRIRKTAAPTRGATSPDAVAQGRGEDDDR
jgi:universal stress protein A